MLEHVVGLLERYDICYDWCKTPRQAHAIRVAEEVLIAPIKSEVSYAAALHEIGHLRGRYQTSPKVMVREAWAWRWAKANALAWTPRMEKDRAASLAWYSARSRKIDARWKPDYEIVSSPT